MNDKQLEAWREVLAQSGIDPRAREQAAARVRQLVEDNDRAIDATLADLTAAARNARDGCASRGPARKLIRFAGCCTDLAELSDRAAAFAHNDETDARRTAESRERASGRRIAIDEAYGVEEIRTVAHLRSVGRTLDNCLAGRRGSEHRRELRDGESEYWAILRHGSIVGLLSLSTDTREVGDIKGHGNEVLDAAPSVVAAIYERLGANAPSPEQSFEEDLEEFLDAVGSGIGEALESIVEGLQGALRGLEGFATEDRVG